MAYDLIIIGTGPGGYVCAIRAAQLGLKVAVVEKRKTFGGTCLNIGCIPSKALLQASEKFHEAAHDLAGFGVIIDTPQLDLAAMMKHKDDTVAANVNGVGFLFKKNKIDSFFGTGTITAPGVVEVAASDGSTQKVEAKNIVIATGSDVVQLPGIAIDEKTIVSSTGALSLERVPKKLLIIGAGVIGLELGSVWGRLGAEVTIVEFLDRILLGTDAEVAKQFQRMLEKQGFHFHLGHKVIKVEKTAADLSVHIEPSTGGDATVLAADSVLVAIGRRPVTDGLGLEAVGVAQERGRVIIDDHFATNVPGIYAIGDVVRGPMLAHKAEDEGIAVAEILAGQHGHVNYGVIPSVVYTVPEIASVGATEEDLKAKGIAYKSGKFPFTANGRARAMRHTEGFVKILADAATDRVLGVHIIGAAAGELIAEACVLMEFGGSAEDLARTCHAHPTLSEAVREAALGVDKRSIHI
ncbi:dihydrolipoyl dehydrogenase [Methylocapsa sp. D3K7]|uniref:dihydrolipoyl dehydrogenase n=1 Tax=Methylocapsa sp. D3K7 TaxID=3041435 RepID=UPI00244EF025|nr:dihydrolipoyl dehydrogenase [Methylocapsa sp. D3K7]WGJ13081.1 dihydrolipoyl dehydrogenase [Methylocapsa sp. D3K7]